MNLEAASSHRFCPHENCIVVVKSI